MSYRFAREGHPAGPLAALAVAIVSILLFIVVTLLMFPDHKESYFNILHDILFEGHKDREYPRVLAFLTAKKSYEVH